MRPIKSQMAIALLIATASAAAADVCITCSGPVAAYACAVKKADKIEALAGPKAIDKICLQVLKRKGQHDSCQVTNTSSCAGAPTTIGWREVKEALATDGDSAEPSQSKKPPAASQPAKTAPGKPVTADKTTQPTPPVSPTNPDTSVAEEPTIGEKVKGAAEKTWKCVSSFFGQC